MAEEVLVATEDTVETKAMAITPTPTPKRKHKEGSTEEAMLHHRAMHNNLRRKLAMVRPKPTDKHRPTIKVLLSPPTVRAMVSNNTGTVNKIHMPMVPRPMRTRCRASAEKRLLQAWTRSLPRSRISKSE